MNYISKTIFKAILILAVFASTAWAGQVLPALGGITGGGTGALDAIYSAGDPPKYAALATGDMCLVSDPTNRITTFYMFYIDTSPQAEDAPIVVVPDEESSGVAYTGNGAWLLMDFRQREITTPKQSGVPGDFYLYEANSTDTDTAGFQGAASMTANTSYRGKFPNAGPTAAGAIASWAASSDGDGTPADPYIHLWSWIYLNDSAGNGATTSIWSADKTFDELALKLDSSSTLNDDNVAFDDADNLWTATAVGPALEELNDSINAGACNGTGAKVHWSQLLGVPAGFADGTDDGSGSVSLGGDGTPDGQIQIANDANDALAADDDFYFDNDILYVPQITEPAASDPFAHFNETDGTDWWIGIDDTGNSFEFRTNATVGNSVQMELDEDGDLHVTGDLDVNGGALQVGDGTYSWGHTPAVGFEGALEVDGVSYLDGGAVLGAKLTLFNSDDPDVSATGDITLDTDGWLRVYQNSLQKAVPLQEEIHVTVVSPNDLADSERDAFWFWSNESGMSFIVTGWKAWSDTDDTTLNIEEIDADGQNNATVDAVEIATNGTGCFTGSDATITGATIENGHLLVLDFDDTDTPGQVKITIYGYYAADVN
jgi:hypothetical protein